MDSSNSTNWTAETKAAYAAGIIDGEGCITIGRNRGGKSFIVAINVGQAVKGWCILEFLAAEFGGGVSNEFKKTEKKAVQKAWFCSGEPACAFLKKIRPYLIFKGPQADLAMRLQEIVRRLPAGKTGIGAKKRWPKSAIAEGEKFFMEMKWFNRKGRKTDDCNSKPVDVEDDGLFNGIV